MIKLTKDFTPIALSRKQSDCYTYDTQLIDTWARRKNPEVKNKYWQVNATCMYMYVHEYNAWKVRMLSRASLDQQEDFECARELSYQPSATPIDHLSCGRAHAASISR